jgi:hypothetical protein
MFSMSTRIAHITLIQKVFFGAHRGDQTTLGASCSSTQNPLFSPRIFSVKKYFSSFFRKKNYYYFVENIFWRLTLTENKWQQKTASNFLLISGNSNDRILVNSYGAPTAFGGGPTASCNEPTNSEGGPTAPDGGPSASDDGPSASDCGLENSCGGLAALAKVWRLPANFCDLRRRSTNSKDGLQF